MNDSRENIIWFVIFAVIVILGYLSQFIFFPDNPIEQIAEEIVDSTLDIEIDLSN